MLSDFRSEGTMTMDKLNNVPKPAPRQEPAPALLAVGITAVKSLQSKSPAPQIERYRPTGSKLNERQPTRMSPAMSTTLAATLVGTVAGTIAWLSGIARAMWPTHPQLGVLLITVFTGLVVANLWPAITRKRS